MQYRKSAEEFFNSNMVCHAVLHTVNGKTAYSAVDLPATTPRSAVAFHLWSLRKSVREFIRQGCGTPH